MSGSPDAHEAEVGWMRARSFVPICTPRCTPGHHCDALCLDHDNGGGAQLLTRKAALVAASTNWYFYHLYVDGVAQRDHLDPLFAELDTYTGDMSFLNALQPSDAVIIKPQSAVFYDYKNPRTYFERIFHPDAVDCGKWWGRRQGAPDRFAFPNPRRLYDNLAVGMSEEQYTLYREALMRFFCIMRFEFVPPYQRTNSAGLETATKRFLPGPVRARAAPLQWPATDAPIAVTLPRIPRFLLASNDNLLMAGTANDMAVSLLVYALSDGGGDYEPSVSLNAFIRAIQPCLLGSTPRPESGSVSQPHARSSAASPLDTLASVATAQLGGPPHSSHGGLL